MRVRNVFVFLPGDGGDCCVCVILLLVYLSVCVIQFLFNKQGLFVW